jgi:hypothetical protein
MAACALPGIAARHFFFVFTHSPWFSKLILIFTSDNNLVILEYMQFQSEIQSTDWIHYSTPTSEKPSCNPPFLSPAGQWGAVDLVSFLAAHNVQYSEVGNWLQRQQGQCGFLTLPYIQILSFGWRTYLDLLGWWIDGITLQPSTSAVWYNEQDG